ncbi:MAG: stage II sporulation protein M [Candidatus Altiarchaeia archaeon]
MVLESIIKPAKMEKHPSEMFLVGLMYSTLGLFLAFYIFPDNASLAAVFITTIPLIVVMINTVKYEETKDMNIHEETFLIKEHGKALSMLFYLFMGMVLSYSFWFTVLPVDYVSSLFDYQKGIIDYIQGLEDSSSAAVGNYIKGMASFERIITNNIVVLFFCILFSFLYGAGAIFILTLNASIIGVAVGSHVRDYIGATVFNSSSQFLYGYFNCSLSATFCYMFHGVFEISSYIVGALAGGIISVAVVNHDFRTKEFWHIVIDSSDMIIMSLILLLLGAFTEAFLTPMIC